MNIFEELFSQNLASVVFLGSWNIYKLSSKLSYGDFDLFHSAVGYSSSHLQKKKKLGGSVVVA